MKIYTKKGDSGETGLFRGGRLPKDSLRVAANGDVDELNATIGLVAATEPSDFEPDLLAAIQSDLLSIGAILSTAGPGEDAKHAEKVSLTKERITALEDKLRRKDEVLSELMEEHVALKKSLGEA